MAYAQFQLVQFIKVEGRKLLLKAPEIKIPLSSWPYRDKKHQTEWRGSPRWRMDVLHSHR